jgi:hypothetical protein
MRDDVALGVEAPRGWLRAPRGSFGRGVEVVRRLIEAPPCSRRSFGFYRDAAVA